MNKLNMEQHMVINVMASVRTGYRTVFCILDALLLFIFNIICNDPVPV